MRNFKDSRGEILFNIDEPPFEIKQCFTTTNERHALRGLHCSPYPKLITVNSGKIFDVIVKPDGKYDAYILNKGDSLLIEANCAHGYFCYEKSEIVYFLGGVFNSVLDKSYLWNDPILNIDWPSEAKNAIISLKDLSNPTFKNIDTIILGSKGYIGKHILKHVPNSIGVDTRLENIDELRKQISILRPKYIISAAGISGKPTIDWCESHKSETIFTNVTCQLNLINLCKELDIHLTIIGSGAVFNGDKLFTEEDEPNFTGTFYSKARSILEGIIRDVYAENVLYLRLLYPITCDGDPMCFVEKLKTRSSNIHNTKITVTILPLLLPNLQTLLQQKITGILNYVNDGITSPSELLNICNVNHVISSEKTNRGLCCLDVSLLKKYTPVENFAELDKIKM